MNGADAEQRAQQYLLGKGLKLLLKNFRAYRGELDLVMLDRDTLVIVEVRKRSHHSFGGSLESIDARKRQRLAMATEQLLTQYPQWAGQPLRFDVIALDADNHIEWLPAAFDTDS